MSGSGIVGGCTSGRKGRAALGVGRKASPSHCEGCCSRPVCHGDAAVVALNRAVTVLLQRTRQGVHGKWCGGSLRLRRLARCVWKAAAAGLSGPEEKNGSNFAEFLNTWIMARDSDSDSESVTGIGAYRDPPARAATRRAKTRSATVRP